MDYFPTINAAMYRIFGASPPTRACVAVDLPSPHRVCLDVVAHSNLDHQNRHSLHVQSLSYWAPANIGPYSQSITVRIVWPYSVVHYGLTWTVRLYADWT